MASVAASSTAATAAQDARKARGQRVRWAAATKEVVDDFHRLYYDRLRTSFEQTSWLGVNVVKCPFDLWLYQELIFEQRPDVIVETGTYMGGSALFLASMCDLVGNGRIYTIDTVRWTPQPPHKRINYIQGSSTNPGILAAIQEQIKENERVLVILDSDHTRDHVLDELRAYASFVTPGSYLIVEDTNVNGHPALPEFGPGPMEAVQEFLLENDNFEVDRSREERFLLTFNPGGWLRRR